MRYIHLVLVLLSVFTLRAQDLDYRSEISIYGGVGEFSVTDNGTIHVGTKAGYLYRSYNPKVEWEYGSISASKDDYDGEHMEHVDFFNNDIGIITGYLHDKSYNDYLYRTTDGGHSWEKIDIEFGKWIDASFVNEEGEAWLASSDQVMYYSNDYGATWNLIDRPENETNQRIIQLGFNNKSQGIAGTGWNRLYYTQDKGKTWNIIKTPLDQGLYEKSENHRPRIQDVAITDEDILIVQNNTVFIKSIENEEWSKIDLCYGFEVDKKDMSVYLFFDEFICEYDKSYDLLLLNKIHYDSKIINSFAINNELYVLHRNSIDLINGDGVSNFPMYTSEYNIEDDQNTIKSNNINWANGNYSLYSYSFRDKRYHRVNIPSMEIENIVPISDQEVLITNSNYLNHVKYNSLDNTITEVNVDEFINPISLSDAKKVVFVYGEYGCFHGSERKVEYLIKKDKVKIGEFAKGAEGKSRVAFNKLLELSDIDRLLEILNLNGNRSYNEVLEGDYSEFDFLNQCNVIDLADAASDEELNYPRASYSTNWKSKEIQIKLKSGKEIKISSNNSSNSIADLSWIVKIDDLVYNCGGIGMWEIYNMGIFPSELDDKKSEMIKYLASVFCK